MPFRYGFELEYCGLGLPPENDLPTGFLQAYWDGTYNECGEICSDVFDTLEDTLLAFHSGVNYLLDKNYIAHNITGATVDEHEATGLHISINDPNNDWISDKDDYDPPIYLAQDERIPVYNRRWPYNHDFVGKPNRYESKHGCSTVNPYAFIKYIHWTACNFMHDAGKWTDHQRTKDIILANVNQPRAMIETILTASATPENSDEILRICDDLAGRVLHRDAVYLQNVGITSLDACLPLTHKKEYFCQNA